MSDLYNLIYEQVKKIPSGKVATYGSIAAMTGNVRRARVVGFALHVNPSQSEIPCHRVVNRYGQTSKAFLFGGADVQRELLEKEGVAFTAEGKVDMDKYFWAGE